MGVAANIALVVAGSYMKFVNSHVTGGSALISLRVLVGTVVAVSAVMMGTKAVIDKCVLPQTPGGRWQPMKLKHQSEACSHLFCKHLVAVVGELHITSLHAFQRAPSCERI